MQATPVDCTKHFHDHRKLYYTGLGWALHYLLYYDEKKLFQGHGNLGSTSKDI